jgi:transcriptional antiterminator NusG
MEWYSLRVISGKEKQIKEAILFEVSHSETHPFKTGDAVKVIDGPFMDFSGFVQEVNTDKQKLKVSVSIFGRPTPIELDYLQVELEK